MEWFLNIVPSSRPHFPLENCGTGDRNLLSLAARPPHESLLSRMLDETQFFSGHGVRSLSKFHESKPFRFNAAAPSMKSVTGPAESEGGIFGGNSNWRGPVWMPLNFLLIESLQKFHHYYGDDFKVECPDGSGKFLPLTKSPRTISTRLTRLFVKDDTGQRPVLKNYPKLANDPHFKDYVLFHEYFHGDTGRGAAHRIRPAGPAWSPS